MKRRFLVLHCALMGIGLTLAACGDDATAGATASVVVSNSPIVLSKPLREDSRSIPFTELVFASKLTGPRSIVANLFDVGDLLSIPGPMGEFAALEVGWAREALSVHVEPFGADSYEVLRTYEGTMPLLSIASTQAIVDGRSGARVVSALGKFSHDTFSILGRWARSEDEFWLESRPLVANAEIENRRRFEVDIAEVMMPRVFLVGVEDCDSDRQGDLLLFVCHMTDALAECHLISGSSLRTIAQIPVDPDFAGFPVRVPDVDGDGVGEVLLCSKSFQGYGLLSPKAHSVIQRVTLDANETASVQVQSAQALGRTSAGIAEILVPLKRSDESGVDRYVVIDAITGTPVSAPVPLSYVRDGPIVSGRMPGGSRRWIAFRTYDEKDPVDRLVVAELGVSGSEIEVQLPVDARTYGCPTWREPSHLVGGRNALCVVAIPESSHDCLAITVAPTSPEFGVAMDFEPIMFLDVARCFEQR